MTFAFNKDYHDLEQVREHLPAFRVQLSELTKAGRYRYNDEFKGYIAGIVGPDEDTAIYLLQTLERAEGIRSRVAEYLASGYEVIEHVDAVTKFAGVVLFDEARSRLWEWEQARLVPAPPRAVSSGEKLGAPWAILPKGARTNGFSVDGRKVLVKR